LYVCRLCLRNFSSTTNYASWQQPRLFFFPFEGGGKDMEPRKGEVVKLLIEGGETGM
jgi:hypothetical protein